MFGLNYQEEILALTMWLELVGAFLVLLTFGFTFLSGLIVGIMIDQFIMTLIVLRRTIRQRRGFV